MIWKHQLLEACYNVKNSTQTVSFVWKILMVYTYAV